MLGTGRTVGACPSLWSNPEPQGMGRMLQIEETVRDRGSRYAVSGGAVLGRAGVDAFLVELKRAKKFAKATHNNLSLIHI